MIILKSWRKQRKVKETLLAGGLCILPTDTIYGIHCRAFDKEAVERVYKLKGRNYSKPFIVLIPDIYALQAFNFSHSYLDTLKEKAASLWPGPNSIVLPVKSDNFYHLHRGQETLAFRIPNHPDLIALMTKTGPLISTSVNPSNKAPAVSIEQAMAYFGDNISLYLDEGKLANPPSSVYKYDRETFVRLR